MGHKIGHIITSNLPTTMRFSPYLFFYSFSLPFPSFRDMRLLGTCHFQARIRTGLSQEDLPNGSGNKRGGCTPVRTRAVHGGRDTIRSNLEKGERRREEERGVDCVPRTPPFPFLSLLLCAAPSDVVVTPLGEK